MRSEATFRLRELPASATLLPERGLELGRAGLQGDGRCLAPVMAERLGPRPPGCRAGSRRLCGQSCAHFRVHSQLPVASLSSARPNSGSPSPRRTTVRRDRRGARGRRGRGNTEEAHGASHNVGWVSFLARQLVCPPDSGNSGGQTRGERGVVQTRGTAARPPVLEGLPESLLRLLDLRPSAGLRGEHHVAGRWPAQARLVEPRGECLHDRRDGGVVA